MYSVRFRNDLKPVHYLMGWDIYKSVFLSQKLIKILHNT
jgi:hypothetical protein